MKIFQMILKSMNVKVNTEDMDSYAAEVDEEAGGKFSFFMFCQVSREFTLIQFRSGKCILS